MTVPTLSSRVAREQASFRAVLDGMARPGTIGRLARYGPGGAFAPAVQLLEALLGHGVSFAVLPDAPEPREALLRRTGSRVYPPQEADFLLCHGPGIAEGLRAARDGRLEYADRGATLIALVPSVASVAGGGTRLTLAGSGVPGGRDVWVDGFTAEHRALFAQRNRAVPLGVDLVLVALDGAFTCLPRATRIEAD
ncbi:MAG TPA: phosphonate C-P lyase system protein PhnH [Chloroflexota bacterium]